ncbi:MAG TPA: homocysteine S-methyltransferase family protein [Acetomicrobium flavidum]|uniref:homocysteine S-methyltransferase family protein n=1 Tax=Acetomicrobium flavidum TaxID=49896 RepID=UPI002CFEE797|nr:homocysteine S-methyltransferase family protein [Acetomicrobium flavidum]HPP14954.1 homocysteine S-methyltransferase family protein [Acetomicrobium flavidum]
MPLGLFGKIFAGRKVLILDGAMGTMLSDKGWQPPALPEEMNLTNSDVVADIHRQYLKSGADIVETNSFGSNPIKLSYRGLEGMTQRINEEAARIARRAADEFGAYVAGSMGPLGELIEPLGRLTFDEAYESYKKQALGLISGGVDFFLIETQLDIKEAKAAVLAVKDVAPHIPFVVSFTFEKNGRTVTGSSPDVIAHWARMIGASAVGLNCGFGPDLAEKVVKDLYDNAGIPVFAYPNAGTPGSKDLEPHEFAEKTAALIKAGACVVGGCCGTTPEHIACLRKMAGGLEPPCPVEIKKAALASRSRLVLVGDDEPIAVIGERINVSRKSPIREEVARYKWDALSEEARRQAECGASVIDINVSLPNVDRKKAMREAIKAVENACMLPLSLDSDEPEVLEEGLIHASGIPLINSVTAERQKLTKGIELAKRFGACLVVLAIDEDGIAETPERRLAAVRKACNIADELEFPRNRMLVDPLTMSVAADRSSGIVALEVLRNLRKLGLFTVMGISNVSHGLPERSLLNKTFLTMAAGAGLDAVIANPLDDGFTPMMMACNLLAGRDEGALRYISWANSLKGKVEHIARQGQGDLLGPIEQMRRCIVQGDKSGILEKASRFLAEGGDPLGLINDVVLPALEEVGRLYECGEYFLPQLISSAEAAQGVCDLVEKTVLSRGGKLKDRGCIIMATVAGDIHDIGKNIVSMVLKSHGFRVIDLGKDVPLERILQEAKKGEAQIVGLSALMTTTMREMERAVKTIKEENLPVKVIIGGAAVSQGYADAIGADGYAPDALSAVRLVEKLLTGEEVKGS